MRELHWHATAAEWAFVDRGARPDDGHRPAGGRGDERLRAGGRLVLPPRPRSHARVPGRRAVPLHADLRQRLLLGVRHVQHQRLDRPHPQAAPGEELRRPRIDLRRVPEEGGVLRPRGAAARASRRPRSQGRKLPPQTHKYRLLANEPIVNNKGGRLWLVDSNKFPISKTDHGRDPRPRPRGAAGAALAPDGRRVAVRHRGEGQRDDVRLARSLPDRDPGEGRRRLHPAGVRALDRERRRQAVPRPHRVQHRGLRGRSTCREWIAGNPLDVLATNFGKPASLFEKFPRKDVFIADKEGSEESAPKRP